MTTASPLGRRQLHFMTIDELLNEIDRLVAADQEDRIQTLGTWTPGQGLGHLAAWIEQKKGMK